MKSDAPEAAAAASTLSDLPSVPTDVTAQSLPPVDTAPVLSAVVAQAGAQSAPSVTQEVPPPANSTTVAVLRPVGARPSVGRWVPLGAALGVVVLGVGLLLFDAREEAAQGELTELTVSSNPAGASVTFDGRPLADRTPFSIDRVATDQAHVVIIELPGHVRWTQRVKLTRGPSNKVHATLQAADP